MALFGSYGRGDAGVGSDLDLLLIDAGSSGPQHQRLLAWPLAELPLSCDALVLTPSEHTELLANGSAMAAALAASVSDLEDRLRILDALYIPTRYPDSLPDGAPTDHFGRLQSDDAHRHARSIVDAIAAALA